MTDISIAPVEQAVAAIKRGEFVIVVDDVNAVDLDHDVVVVVAIAAVLADDLDEVVVVVVPVVFALSVRSPCCRCNPPVFVSSRHMVLVS